jgi:multicomponent Na+:H+ antiporter subunit B
VSRRVRTWVLVIGVLGVGAVLLVGLLDLPPFGRADHPYRDAAVAAAVAHATSNVVTSVNFDQRAFDTLGEEIILFGSVVAVSALLRPGDDEEIRRAPANREPLQATRLIGYLLLPLTLVVGLDVVAHGAVTPGGGFQGGVVLATGLHLLYVAGQYRSLERLRPEFGFEVGEAVGAAGYLAIGLAGLAGTGAFLAQLLPLGAFGQLLSAGTVPLLNVAVGIAVGSGVVVLLGQFLRQVELVAKDDGDPATGAGDS